MLPKTLVQDETQIPNTFDGLLDLAETNYRVEHERTTLESITLNADGTIQTPTGQWTVTQDFLESCAALIKMPLPYAYAITPELFSENFRQRQAETTAPITICRIGDVAVSVVDDRRSRYRPARTVDVLRSLAKDEDWEFRRGSISFAGVDVEFVRRGMTVEPVVGDVVEIGAAIMNSETGGRQLMAKAYAYRLVCTNGAMLADTMGIARWPNDPRMTPAGSMMAFQRILSALCDRLDDVAAIYSASVGRAVPDVELWQLWRRVAYLLPRERADRALGLTEDERRNLQRTIRDREPNEAPALTPWTAYEVHNRVTHAAHGQRFRVRRGLQELGGELLTRAASWLPALSVN